MTATPKNQVQARIIDVTLDSRSFAARTSEIEIERHKAISDLLDDNRFAIGNAPGPFKLMLSIEDERLILQAACTKTAFKEDIRLALAPFRQLLADYTILCDSFYKTAREGHIHRLETIDQGRRSIHDEAAEKLQESLAPKVNLDKMTARRLFSLVYVLHMRNHSTIRE